MILSGDKIKKDILRGIYQVSDIAISDETIIFNKEGYAVVSGKMFEVIGDERKEIPGVNLKGIIDNDFNEVFPFRSYNDECDNIPGLFLIDDNIIFKEKINYGSPSYAHTKIENGVVETKRNDEIDNIESRFDSYTVVDENTIVITKTSYPYYLNKINKPIAHSKRFLYNLNECKIISDAFDEMSPNVDDKFIDVKIYALEPTDKDWKCFIDKDYSIHGKYPITSKIDKAGNYIESFALKHFNNNSYFSLNINSSDSLDQVRRKALEAIRRDEDYFNKFSSKQYSSSHLRTYSLATLKELSIVLTMLDYKSKDVVTTEIERRGRRKVNSAQQLKQDI